MSLKNDYHDNRFDDMSDDELISIIREGNDKALDFLMDKYKNLVRKKAKSMYLLGGETEDLIQEGMIGLFQAIRDFDFGRDTTFITFADLCVARKMYNAIKSSNGNKHIPLNNYISISGIYSDGDLEQIEQPILDNIPATEELNPETMVIDNEQAKRLEDIIKNQLTDLEYEVFQLYLTGMSNTEVARVLGMNPKTTDNAIQRAKSKLKKLLNKVL